MSKSLLSTEDVKKANVDELLSRLSASRDGLSSSEAEKRLQQSIDGLLQAPCA